jgi:hypothetical protein
VDQEAQSLFIKLVNLQDEVFPEAGLGEPTIPTGASARTIMRYEGSLNSTLFRCLRILEARRLAREDRGNIDEHDYSADTIEADQPRQPTPIRKREPAPKAKKAVAATPPESASAPENPPAAGELHESPEEEHGGDLDPSRNAQDDRSGAPHGRLHKRTQNNLVDEALSTFADLTPEALEELTREVERKIRNQIS